MDVRKMSVVLEIGEFRVYKVDGSDLFFYRINNDVNGFGPFRSIMEAGRHYEHFVVAARKEARALAAPVSDIVAPPARTPSPNVVQVDFFSKKRI